MPARSDGKRWLKRTRDWWVAVWQSPMVPEWDDSDRHNVEMLAHLVDEFFRTESASQRKELHAEIRLGRQALGLSPLDRRRLSWEIDRAEQAEERMGRRQRAPFRVAEDPRPLLGDS